jgi:putative alpha-1,2-mannosidase
MKAVISPLLFLSACSASNVKYVDPMIGTDPVFPSNGNYAGMIPTVGTPFAMTRWTAYTFENYVGTCPYHYTEDSFHGFLATHQPAQWMGESGEMSVAPGVGDVKTAFKDRGLKFSHDNEVSSPQYYKTVLATSGENIVAELSGTSRAGVMRFTFSENDSPFVVVQATRTSISGEVTVDPKNREVYGWNPERQDDVLGPFTADDFKGYFVARFDTEFASWGTANGATLFENSLSGKGEEVSGYVRFAAGTPVVNVRVGVSYISVEQARVNLDLEIGDGSVEDVSAAVEKQWADKLDLVELTNASEDDLVIFYTAMYHALQVLCQLVIVVVVVVVVVIRVQMTSLTHRCCLWTA